MGFISLILKLLRMIFGGSKSAPSEEAKAAAGQAAATTALRTEIAANESVQAASTARDAVVAHDVDSVRLHAAEADDPDNRARQT